ncbi:MAG: hypothetical protein K2G40_06185 [Muribaculaceae bacterium]|nr:hypothetical protein [Muribaculaceae bacterium]
MSSKRLLKKRVRYVCGDLAAECILAKNFIEGVDGSKMSDIVVKIARLQEATLNKISFAFDKISHDFENKAEFNGKKSKYMKLAFNSLKSEFNQDVLKIVKEMNAVLPQEQKDLNKANK